MLTGLRALRDQVRARCKPGGGRRERFRLAVADDQERIGRDLHDTVIQQLFATGLSLQATLARIGDVDAATRVDAAVGDLDAMIRHIRLVISGLQRGAEPPRRDGPAPDLRVYVLERTAQAGRALGFAPCVTFTGPVSSLGARRGGDDLVADVVATLCEALSNVARHARAGRVDVELAVIGDMVRLCVADDGIGPGCSQPETTSGDGLRNMAARARARGGRFTIEVAGDRGARVTWQVPIGAAGAVAVGAGTDPERSGR